MKKMEFKYELKKPYAVTWERNGQCITGFFRELWIKEGEAKIVFEGLNSDGIAFGFNLDEIESATPLFTIESHPEATKRFTFAQFLPGHGISIKSDCGSKQQASLGVALLSELGTEDFKWAMSRLMARAREMMAADAVIKTKPKKAEAPKVGGKKAEAVVIDEGPTSRKSEGGSS